MKPEDQEGLSPQEKGFLQAVEDFVTRAINIVSAPEASSSRTCGREVRSKPRIYPRPRQNRA